MQGSWASWGTDTWYLGPLADHYHYRCNLYFVPETCAYHILGLVKLFLQHFLVPNLSPNAHLKALTKELQIATVKAAGTPKGRRLIKSLAMAIKAILPCTNAEEQRLATVVVIGRPPSEDAPIVMIQRISDAPGIIQTRDLSAKQNMITTMCIHRHQTQNNTPGALPKIKQAKSVLIQPDPYPTTETQGSTRIHNTTSPMIIILSAQIPGGPTSTHHDDIARSPDHAHILHTTQTCLVYIQHM